jgi:hypothetical protein
VVDPRCELRTLATVLFGPIRCAIFAAYPRHFGASETPRVSYSGAQKREAVALARAAGAEYAAESLGVDPRTVRKWLEAAGDPPELDGTAAGWTQLLDLAQSQVATALASGKVRPKDAAVIAAIAERNLRQLADREKRKPEPQDPWADRFDRWCDETYPSRRLAEMAKDVPSHVLGYVLRSRRLEYGLGQDEVESRSGPEDNSFWFEWACATVEAVGDLETFQAEYQRWHTESQTYDVTLSRRTETIMWSGVEGHTGHTAPPPIRYPEALEIARLMSADLLPIAPAWAVVTEGLVGDSTDARDRLMDNDDIDAADHEIAGGVDDVREIERSDEQP